MGLFQDVFESADGGVFTNLRDSAGNGITSTLVSAKQALDVNLVNSITVGVADKTTFTYGTSFFEVSGGVFQDTSPTLTAGQSGASRLTAQRGLHVNLRSAAGVEVGDSNADGLWTKLGDGTNVGSFSATSEQFVQLRQGGNVANVTAANESKVIDTNSGLVLALMKPTTGTLSQVAVTTSSGVALALNAARKGFSIVNDTNKTVYLAMAATASTVAYSVRLAVNSFYEQLDSRVYTGVISCIGAAAVAGNVTVTEYT